MSKVFKKSYVMTALICMLIACLTCGTLVLTANAQEEEPTSTVTFTSYTTVMKVDEEFEFAAQVTLEDGTTSTDVTWSSSDEDIIYIEEGLATALAEGNATITATAADGASASVDVYVSESAIHVESIELYPDVLELGVGWKTRVGYTAFPDNASDQRVTFASSDPSIVAVDENGNIESLAAGNAVITVTAYDSGITATAAVAVYADLGEATIAPATLVTTIGQVTDNELTVTLPDTVPADAKVTYKWYSSYDNVASVDLNDDATGSVFSWNFGTTTIYVVASYTYTDAETEEEVTARYAASATVHVTSEYFYLTGLVSDLANPEDNPWVEYGTEEAAKDAGVLLVPDADNPYVYSITRSFWASDVFQIIHGNIDADWTTKITSTSFDENGSTLAYVANTAVSFGVTDFGTYRVILDLSDGPAKVRIEMVELEVTSVTLSVASDNAYLQYVTTAEEGTEVATRTMRLNIETLPAAATYNPEDVIITIPEDMQEYVTAVYDATDATPQIVLTLLKAPEANTSFDLNVAIANSDEDVVNANDNITITILADGEEYVEVTDIHFTSESYLVNVNNGAQPWVSSTPIAAVVNEDASVQGVVYSTSSAHIWIEYVDGQAYVHADALGTYQLTATALGNSEVKSDPVNVLVTSLIETETEESETKYSTGFYLIGQLDGEEVEGWTSIKPEVTTFEGSDFANWTLPVVAGTNNTVYSAEYNLRAHDVFSIAFLGMDGNWFGIINNQYMNWDDSVGTYWENGINIEMSENGRYAITLNLSGEVPSFTVARVGDYNPEQQEYDLYLYIVRSGDSWDGSISDENNIIATVGYIHMVDGVAQSMTLTIDSVDFYEFYTTSGEWPTIQFVTAYGGTYGLEGGYFQNATWYGSAHTGITFGGDAYSATGEDGRFTNFNSELYWVGDITADVNMKVSFTFTFDESGALTAVELNFVTATEVPAE